MKRKSVGKNDFSFEIRRQLVHAGGVLTVPIILYLGKLPSLIFLATVILFFLILAAYKLEKTRRGKNILLEELAAIENFFEEKIYKKFERKESFPMRGAIMFYFGAFLTLLIFSEQIAAAGIAVLAIADSASTIIGKKFGRHRIFENKTLEGSLAFFVSAAAVLLFFISPERALIAAFTGALAEAFGKIDDNLTVPLATAAALAIF